MQPGCTQADALRCITATTPYRSAKVDEYDASDHIVLSTADLPVHHDMIALAKARHLQAQYTASRVHKNSSQPQRTAYDKVSNSKAQRLKQSTLHTAYAPSTALNDNTVDTIDTGEQTVQFDVRMPVLKTDSSSLDDSVTFDDDVNNFIVHSDDDSCAVDSAVRTEPLQLRHASHRARLHKQAQREQHK